MKSACLIVCLAHTRALRRKSPISVPNKYTINACLPICTQKTTQHKTCNSTMVSMHSYLVDVCVWLAMFFFFLVVHADADKY